MALANIEIEAILFRMESLSSDAQSALRFIWYVEPGCNERFLSGGRQSSRPKNRRLGGDFRASAEGGSSPRASRMVSNP